MIRKAAVIGLGRLGLPVAACLAAKGIEVIGADVDADRVTRLNAGECPLFEPGLAEMLARTDGRLGATTNVAEAVCEAEAIFVVVPTPSLPDGAFSLEHVLDACIQIGGALRDAVGRRLVVISSTVSPESTGGKVREALERASGRRCGADLGLCYSPEFIALGSVINDFLHPDFVLIGESDAEAGRDLAAIYGMICESEPPVFRMTLVNAEIAKVAVNTYVTTKIAFANMLSDICERVEGGDVDAVTTALGMDRRIGSAYLRGGLSYGGPCFPRDNRALAAFARTVGVEPVIPEATDSGNAEHRLSVIDLIGSRAPSGGSIAVLGLAYKTSTDVVERSAGLEIAEELGKRGFKIVAFDPAARDQARARIGDTVQILDSLDDCLAFADVVVVATAWDQIVAELGKALHRTPAVRIVVDCWRCLDPRTLPPEVELVRVGVA